MGFFPGPGPGPAIDSSSIIEQFIDKINIHAEKGIYIVNGFKTGDTSEDHSPPANYLSHGFTNKKSQFRTI